MQLFAHTDLCNLKFHIFQPRLYGFSLKRHLDLIIKPIFLHNYSVILTFNLAGFRF